MTPSDQKALKADELQSGGFFGNMFGEIETISTPTKDTPKKVEEKEKKTTPTKDTHKKVEEKEPEIILLKARKIIDSSSKPKKQPQLTKEKIQNKPKEAIKDSSSVSADDLLKASEKFGNAKIVRSTASSGGRSRTSTSKGGIRRDNAGATRSSHNRGSRAINKPTFSKGKTKYENGKFVKPAATPSAKTDAPKIASVSSDLKKKNEITIGNSISVKEFSEKTGVPFPELMKVMMMNKIMGGINTSLDYDTAALIGEELSIKVHKEQDTVSVESIIEGDLTAILDLDKEADNLQTRPPIVTIMGHVDHGKTSLLDYLRKTDIAGGEAGGITQSIGASTITYQDKQITFIDTPGHELFTSMRARGAKMTDLAIIIVAADDGLMPQTIESINHAKEADVPVILAITKIDKPGANKQQDIKNNIGNYGLIPEEWGGNVPVVEISSKTGQGIDDLLEHITLQAEVLELQYNPDRSAVGVVLDAKKSAKQGIETSLIVMTGNLSVGDVVVVHNTYGKVKRMIDRKGKAIKRAYGGDPVQILGISDAPEPGRIVEGVESEKEASQKVAAILASEEAKASQASTLQSLIQQMNQGEKTTVKLILKADGPTTLEALKQSIKTVERPDNVEIKTVHTDIGQFTESDLALAQASEALLIGFNVRIPASLLKKAEQSKVTLKSFDIIYELTEYIEDLAMGLLEVEMEEVVVGKLDVLGVFFRKAKEMVIGGKCIEGEITNGDKFRIMRNDEQIGQGNITSLQKETQSVKVVKKGHECGMKVKVSKVIEEGDQIHFVQEREVQ